MGAKTKTIAFPEQKALACEVGRARIAVPIVVLNTRTNEPDKVLLLELGTGDYGIKRFNSRELLARIRSAIRSTSEYSASQRVDFGSASIDFSKMEATFAGKPVHVTTRELKLLHLLIQNEDRVVRRDEVLTKIFGHGASSKTRTMDNLIAGLRRQLESDPANPRHILTVHGVGYRFAQDAREELRK